MAFGKDRDIFLLKEGFYSVGTWVNPQNIASNVSPLLSFTSAGDIGYFKMGTFKAPIKRSYAQFKAGTPHQLVRMDLIEKEPSQECDLAQWSTDLLSLVQGLLVDTGPYPIAWIGPDEPTETTLGYLQSTQLTNGVPFYNAIWIGSQVGEEVGESLDGSAHAVFKSKVVPFPSADFANDVEVDQKSYGAYWFDHSLIS